MEDLQFKIKKRGATVSDLNNHILFGIHNDIKKQFGDKAGLGFVKMVDGIKVLSATAFLNSLYELFNNDWKYNKRATSSIHIPKDKNGNYDEVIGMVSIFEAFSSGNRDDTNIIKSHFLSYNGVKVKKIYNDYFG